MPQMKARSTPRIQSFGPAPLQGRTTGKSTYGSNFNNNSSNEVLSNSRSIKMTLVNKA